MISAIVVARAGSKRLPRKALLPFGTSTLVGHKVRELCKCKSIDRVYVGSDSHEILEEGEAQGAIAVLNRDYADDSREMIADTVARIPYLDPGSIVIWAHPTNPLVKPETYDDAVAEYESALTYGFDSLVSVHRVQRHAWVDGKPFNYDPYAQRHALAADVEPVFFQDGAIFIQTAARFIETRYFFGARPSLFNMPGLEWWDIDTSQDYQAAVALCESPCSPVAHPSSIFPAVTLSI